MVTENTGARVTFPAGAVTEDTTFRIAVDSSGAPPLPDGLESVGNIYVITPHGGNFSQPVQVSIPAPTGMLQADQQLKLAKAEPNGQWQILDDAALVDGKLTATVRSFSFFTTVIVTFQLPVLQLEPFRFVTTVTCDQADCAKLVGPATLTYTVRGNGGQLPAGCGNPTAYTGTRGDSSTEEQAFPLTGTTITRTVAPQEWGYFQFASFLYCEGFLGASAFDTVGWSSGPAYPQVSVMRVPAQLDVVEGMPAHLDAMLGGGVVPRYQGTGLVGLPTATDRAVVDWQRSDDSGASWRNIARSFQDEADPLPYGTGMPWRPWGSRHGFVATIMDQGALIRVRVCYTPPAPTAPPPCDTGPATRINVVQQSALPRIVDAPRSVLVRTGQTASFSVSAAGIPAPSLQLQTRAANSTGDWSDVSEGSGATSTNYTTPVRLPSHNGTQYRVVATNALGSAASTPVILSVSDIDVAPTITTQPAPLSVVNGNDAVFAVVAHGTEALSYQWRFNGTNIMGANSPVLRLDGVTFTNAGSYSVAVSNAAGNATSNAAVLTVTDGIPEAIAPSIVTQPSDVSVNVGQTATFAVGVAGTGPFTFQWLRDGAPVSGATSAVLTFNSAALPNAGTYSVRVTNSAGQVVSASATLDVIAAGTPIAPTITSQPASLVLPFGGSGILAVGATGTGPLSYQWLVDDYPIPGATDAVLHFDNVDSTAFGTYTVTVSNSVGSVTSEVAELIRLGTPVITQQPAPVAVTEGESAMFSVQASGSNLRYQWLLNGTEIGGAIEPVLYTDYVVAANSGAVYSVMVYNGAGLVVSDGAVLTVDALAAPAVTKHPVANATVEIGDEPQLCAAFSGTLPMILHRQLWNGTSWDTISTGGVGDHDDHCFLFGPVTLAEDGQRWRFVAENAAGQVATDPMILTVLAPAITSTTMVSVELDGGAPDYASGMPSLSKDGRLVAFTSQGLDLVAGGTTNGSESGHAYLRNLVTGTTTLINRTVANGVSSRGVVDLKLSSNGRYALFTSFANDLVAGDTNNSLDVFRRDLQTGVTERVNVLPEGSQIEDAGNANYDARLAISGDGRYVAFISDRNLVGDGSGNDGYFLYLRDMQNGITNYVAGTPATSPVGYVAISDNGWYVFYTTNVAAPDSQTIWRYSVGNGVIFDMYTYAQTPAPAGQRQGLSVSDDGRFVAFTLNSAALTGSAFDQVMVLDCDYPFPPRVVSVGESGAGDDNSAWPRISGDGRYVLFETQAPNLTDGLGLSWRRYAVVRDLQENDTHIASHALNGAPLELGAFGTAAISGNGRTIAFANGQVYAAPTP
ncbi:MAG TPA: immunoglobulin domain-containing protein [Steroidobacteraceae bacterium]|nr:immunoglobulin domain-containing protein [Steroidobacteraceae bacterium]